MRVEVTDNTPQILDLVRRKQSIGLRRLANQVVKTSRPKTPKDKGDLRNNTLVQVLGLRARIAWNQDYAFIQEHTQFRNYTTPGTGPHFAEDAVNEVVSQGAGLLIGGELL